MDIRVSGKQVKVQTRILLALLLLLLVSRIFFLNIYLEVFLILFIIISVLAVYKFHKERAMEAVEKTDHTLSRTKYAEMLKKDVGHTDEVLASILADICARLEQLSSGFEEIVEYSRAVTAKSDQISLGADAQAFSLQETAGSVDGISKSIKTLVGMVEKLFPHAERAASAIMEMVSSNKSISESTLELVEHVDRVSGGIAEMVRSVKEMENKLIALSSTSEETSKSVMRIDRSAGDIEEKVHVSSELAEQVKKDADKGMAASAKSIEGISRIRDIMAESSKVIQRLGEKSGEIGEVITVIDGVTNKTSLLALNASIIAAQAGEHGKSFSVVAGEIKKLAEQTAASTIEITALIKGIQTMVTEAVQANELGTWSIEEGVRLSQETGNALKMIMESTKKASEMSHLMAAYTVDQSRETRIVLDSIRDQVEVIRETASAMKEHAARSEKISLSTAKMVEITKGVARANMEQEKANVHVTRANEEVKELVRGMSDITKNQKTDSDQIKQAVEIIGFISEENIRAIKELSEGIAGLTERLEKLGSDFKSSLL